MKGYLDLPQIDPHVQRLIRWSFRIVIVILVVANSIVFYYVDGVSKDPVAPVAIILGGGMNRNGTQSKMQHDRVATGIELYKKGNVQRLLMSGDDGALRFNEVDAMKQQAIDAGVPEEDIVIDPHAYRTYLSCYRATHEFDIDTAVIVTQWFHLPRALYLCERMGIDTRGVPADIGPYPFFHTARMHIRDVFARVKAVWQVEITKPTQ